MTRSELLALAVTTDIQTAARALGIGRSLAYEMAAAGEFPVRIFKVGVQYRVVTESLLEFLGVDRVKYDGTNTSVVSMLTGLSPERLHELGGVPED